MSSNVWFDAPNRILGVGLFKVQVFGPCSGYEGVALITAFLSIYFWVFRRDLKFPQALILYPIGIVTIWLLNALRIALLVSIGAHFSPEVAVQGFHSAAGWIGFLLVTFASIAILQKSSYFSAGAANAGEPTAVARSSKPRAALVYLAPFVALVSSSIVASAFVPHDQWLYALKVAAIAGALWWLRSSYAFALRQVSVLSIVAGVAVGVAWIVTDPGKGAEVALGTWLTTLPLWLALVWLALRAVGLSFWCLSPKSSPSGDTWLGCSFPANLIA